VRTVFTQCVSTRAHQHRPVSRTHLSDTQTVTHNEQTTCFIIGSVST